MPQVLLTDAARALIVKMMHQGLVDFSVLVITTDEYGDYPIARFTDRSVAEMVKATCLGEVLPGLPVYSFGIDPFSEDVTVVLDPSYSRSNPNANETTKEFHLNYTFHVLQMPKTMAQWAC